MNIKTITEEFKNSGVSLIQVMDFDIENKSSFSFIGELPEYIAAVKDLGAKATFLNIGTLPEEAFILNIGHELNDINLSSVTVDLSSTNKNLNKYKKHIGENAFFRLFTTSTHGGLELTLEEEWFEEFYELLELEKDKVTNAYLEEAEESENHKTSKQNELLQIVKSLKDDEKFCKCKTQIIKTAFALEKYPELKDLDSGTLKTAIANVVASIEARRMLP